MTSIDARTQAVGQLRELWPHLNWAERWTWIGKMVPLFDGDWQATVLAVMPDAPPVPEFVFLRGYNIRVNG